MNREPLQPIRPYTTEEPTEVHPVETNGNGSEATASGFGTVELTNSSAWRHAGWARQRSKVYEALRRLDVSHRRMGSFIECGQFSWIQRDRKNHERYALKTNACHDRFCVPCCTARGTKLSARVAAKMATTRYRMITLTLKHNPAHLADQIDRLVDCFRNLRKTRLWKTHVKGGVAFTEVKLSDRTGLWHPHLHILCHGRFIDKNELKKAWLAVTGDSMVTSIDMVKDRKHAADYTAKYCTKGWDHPVFANEDKLAEAIAALRGRRLVTTFGSWRGFKLNEPPEPGDWEQVAPLDEYLTLAEQGDPHAIWVLRTIRNLPAGRFVPPIHAPPTANDTPNRLRKPRPNPQQLALADWDRPCYGF